MKAVGLLAVAGTLFLPASGRTEQWVLEAVGTATAPPDVVHLLMKMEYESGLAADAAAGGEKRLHEFLGAVDALKIGGLVYRVTNNVFLPSSQDNAGFVYSRNVVFDLANGEAGTGAGPDTTIARLEDLGARYNSHCVTCIGSG